MKPLDPHTAAVMTPRTEKQILSELVSILSAEIYEWLRPNATRPILRLDVDELAEYIGNKYAYLTARRCKFRPGADGWTRHPPFAEGEVWIDLDIIIPPMRRALRHLDPLGLLRPFMAGVTV